MNIFTAALAEQATQTAQTVENMTPQEAAAGGAVLGAAMGIIAIIGLVWFVLQVIADWKIFSKAGEPGWKSIIPIYNVIVEYGLCWTGAMGAVYMILTVVLAVLRIGQNSPTWMVILAVVLSICALVIHIMQSLKLARSFGKGTGFGICLILFGPIARVVLGLGSATYIGNKG